MSTFPVHFSEMRDSDDLPSPTGVGMKILELTRTDDYSVEDMGSAILTDPSLTGRILDLANSASHAAQEPITTVSGAVMRLGAQTVRDLALAFSLVSDRQVGACRPFDYERYWSLSLARAVVSQALIPSHTGVRPEEAYICGLLAEIGMLALASVHSERYGRILLKTQGQSLKVLREAENEAFDIDHAIVGKCMLSDWGLPERIVEAVADFGQARSFRANEPNLDTLPNVLRFADAVGGSLLLGETTPPRRMSEIQEVLDVLREVLGKDEAEFETFWNGVAREWRQWGKSLDIETFDVTYAQARESIERGAIAYQEHGADAPVADEPEAAPTTADAPAQAPTAATTTARDVLDDQATARNVRRPNPAPKPTADASKTHVLAVDDDPVSLRLLVKHLRTQGYEVSMARDGKEGLKRALQEQPALIIVDQEMPGLNGLEVVRALRRSSIGSSMYILLLTGNENEELLVDAFDAGADDFVKKPFKPPVLAARMKAGVRISRLQRKVEADRRTIVEQLNEKNALNRKLERASLTDPLTGLANRRHAMNRLEAEWKASERSDVPFSVIMLDIDKFKSVNDTYGHDVGDEVLIATAQCVKGALRGEDEVFRLGGEEFLVICRGAYEVDGALVAERIRAAVEANVIPSPGFEKAVTVSLGVAGIHPDVPSLMDLLKSSDEAVYRAKDAGRNQVQVAGAPAPTSEQVERLRRTA